MLWRQIAKAFIGAAVLSLVLGVPAAEAKDPKDIRIATLLVKPDKLQVKLDIDYVAMNIPNDFIVGYGLDYDGKGRNYRDIYTVVNE